MEMKKTLVHIRQMHRDISKITRVKDRKCYEYLEDFVKVMSGFIDKLGIFPYHIVWECIYDKVPENLQVEENYILRDATGKERRNAPVKSSETFNYPKDKYFQPQFSKKDFGERFRDYFKSGTPADVFEIPFKIGFSYFNLPVFSERENLPQWILTLIYRKEESDSLRNEDFSEIMEHISHETGLAWIRFREIIADRLLRNIDLKLVSMEKTRSSSFMGQLKEIAGILAQEINLEWCGFFLYNEKEDTLKLEISNIDPGSLLDYSIDDSSDIMVNCFEKNKRLILFGRRSLEDIVKPETMKPIEKAIRQEKKQRKIKQGKNYPIPYILFEHALYHPIFADSKKLALSALYRAKKVQKPEPEDRFEYVTRPFSGFEIHLIRKVRRYVLNIFLSHKAVQQRMRDIRDIMTQVISPISAIISTSDRLKSEQTIPFQTTIQKFTAKLDNVHDLSRVTEKYIKNFEVLLDMDTHSLQTKKERIPDLRGYLIEHAKLFTSLVHRKCISVNVTKETRSDISIEVDSELFDLVISNIIDNAVKYSFDPEERERLGLQPKPAFTQDKENVLITAEVKKNAVTITVSNYGIEITEEEKRRIFERNFRGFKSDDRARGMGIGLFVLREIIEKHGGTIELVPGTPKYNTVFKIFLPQKGTGNMFNPGYKPGNK